MFNQKSEETKTRPVNEVILYFLAGEMLEEKDSKNTGCYVSHFTAQQHLFVIKHPL